MRYFKQIIQIEIVSDEVPLEWDNLDDIKIALDNGTCHGKVAEQSCAEISQADYFLAKARMEP